MNIKSITKKYSKKAGFTILETLVAVFILTLSLTGPMAFSQSGLRAAFLARDQITAFFLAQDAIETIKNIRDQNELDGSGTDWLTGLDNCDPDAVSGDDNTSCSINTFDSAPTIATCDTDGAECAELKYDSSTGRFEQKVSGQTSLFKRSIYINETVDDQEAEIVVLVTWNSKAVSGTRKIVVQETMMNWYPEP